MSGLLTEKDKKRLEFIINKNSQIKIEIGEKYEFYKVCCEDLNDKENIKYIKEILPKLRKYLRDKKKDLLI